MPYEPEVKRRHALVFIYIIAGLCGGLFYVLTVLVKPLLSHEPWWAWISAAWILSMLIGVWSAFRARSVVRWVYRRRRNRMLAKTEALTVSVQRATESAESTDA